MHEVMRLPVGCITTVGKCVRTEIIGSNECKEMKLGEAVTIRIPRERASDVVARRRLVVGSALTKKKSPAEPSAAMIISDRKEIAVILLQLARMQDHAAKHVLNSIRAARLWAPVLVGGFDFV
ncbi:hypothetical protein COCMIDRAFT_29454 [Bipolaris oryzae ATCC 44560]|uniref:Uncharacterized protein n=1 Tax=Bipolaris oryzae ATCC 44560 TaxID=930090 RepID=W6YWA8_COCMI|nr:uncharacterized protein COCMIDRAFT_29454 [Bipolaris oryzae ATCC 44560]EUC41835.1 hypothetical protein COCMIDRAFT_29454 [Bipolaris oryzae ATCC 44560]